MIPYNNDTRQTYLARCKEAHLLLAKIFHEKGRGRSMWLQLFYYAMAEDIYGEHWDQLTKGESK